MSKYEYGRATNELRQWMEEIDRALNAEVATTESAAAANASLAAARDAHKSAWQAQRADNATQLYSLAANAPEGQGPPHFAFFFHRPADARVTPETSESGPQRRLRKMRMLKLMLLQIGIGSIGACGGSDPKPVAEQHVSVVEPQPAVVEADSAGNIRSSIVFTRDDTRAVVVNRQKATVSVIRVRDEDGADVSEILGEVPVGKEPRYIELSPDDRRAYVTNGVDGRVTVIDLTGPTPKVMCEGCLDSRSH